LSTFAAWSSSSRTFKVAAAVAVSSSTSSCAKTALAATNMKRHTLKKRIVTFKHAQAAPQKYEMRSSLAAGFGEGNDDAAARRGNTVGVD
jgi:hypothetical protein